MLTNGAGVISRLGRLLLEWLYIVVRSLGGGGVFSQGRLQVGLWRRDRAVDEEVLRFVVGERSATVRDGGGGQTRARGLEYVAWVLGCDVKTIQQGREELEQTDDPAAGRVRKKGVDANG